MIALNAAVMLGVLLHKITLPPFVPYIHLLVDYHFGFTKRALIGATVSVFAPKVPVWLVFALGAAIWLVTLGLFVVLFRRTFSLGERQMPLFVFMVGSPFFFKNFMHTLGHFDIYGCAFAIVLLLIPARSILFVAAAAAASLILILIHQIHFLMYVPTIAALVVLRYYLVRSVSRPDVIAGIAAVAAVGVLFLVVQVHGSMTVPEDQFISHLRERMADPSQTRLLTFGYIWYQGLGREIRDTWTRMPSNLLGVPVFALLIWLHAPLQRYFAALIRSLSDDMHRRAAVAAIIAVSVGYLVIFAVVFDYSRWISNWAVCMFLLLHAVKTLPAALVEPVAAYGRRNTVFGWIVTLIPRVGIVRPF
ncbi:hypothetical protein [uncultured Bradyrhizobium sp.]|uniref:hypothetical protein n=1 Tax=uncultured Bradyrhizobium sp. TaxID=199684 RepID=UPI0035C990AB